MKKIVLTCIVLVTTTGAFCQGSVISKYFDKYSNDSSFSKVSVSSKMFSLFTELEGFSDEEQEFVDVIRKLKGLKVLTGDNVPNAKVLFNRASSDVDKEGYEELMTVTDAKENVKISIKEKGGTIEELMIVVGGNSSFFLVSLYGEIDMKKISKVVGSMKLNGLHHLKKLDEKNKSQ